MTEIAYEPPERILADTLMAFKDFEMSSKWRVRIQADPLGPVNKILTLMRGQERIRSVLWPVPVGVRVRLVRDEGGWSMPEVFSLRQRIWDARDRGEDVDYPPIHPPGWRIEVNDETVLTVTDAEMVTPYVAPPVPWRERVRRAIHKRARDIADQIAGELGYHRDDECRGWNE